MADGTRVGKSCPNTQSHSTEQRMGKPRRYTPTIEGGTWLEDGHATPQPVLGLTDYSLAKGAVVEPDKRKAKEKEEKKWRKKLPRHAHNSAFPTSGRASAGGRIDMLPSCRKSFWQRDKNRSSGSQSHGPVSASSHVPPHVDEPPALLPPTHVGATAAWRSCPLKMYTMSKLTSRRASNCARSPSAAFRFSCARTHRVRLLSATSALRSASLRPVLVDMICEQWAAATSC